MNKDQKETMKAVNKFMARKDGLVLIQDENDGEIIAILSPDIPDIQLKQIEKILFISED
jgi:hypothetical protein